MEVYGQRGHINEGPVLCGNFKSDGKNFLYVSQEISVITGFPAGMLQKMPITCLFESPEKERFNTELERTLRGETNGFSLILRTKHQEGHAVFIGLTVEAVNREGEKILSGSVVDMTAFIAKDAEFVHQLRTCLNSICGFSSLLKSQGACHYRAGEYISYISRSAWKINDYIKDLEIAVLR